MHTRVRRRRILAAALAGAALAALGVTVVSRAAAPELVVNAHGIAPLRAHVTYGARTFPLGLNVTPSDGTWAGTQYRRTTHGRPAFGWVVLGHPPSARPLGVVAIVTAYGSTPGVAPTIERLRAGGSGADYGPAKPVRIAGMPGTAFDGNVWGKWGHVFVAFTPATSGASPPDAERLDKGEVFRIAALDVRGKTVVVFYESWGLPPAQFPAFLTSANRTLATLRFGT